jgi:ribonuclease VapC
MALTQDEDGATVVAGAIERGAVISVANWAEALSRLAECGKDPQRAASELRKAEGEQRVLTIEPIAEADCITIAQLRPITKAQGLSLADRACLALAARLGVPALTADHAWEQANVDVEIKLIR